MRRVILRLAILIQYQFVTDRKTDPFWAATKTIQCLCVFCGRHS